MTKRRGFTIVELLIVIVVIAILAAVTIATYRGIQGRARTASQLVTVDQVEKQLRLLHLQHPDSLEIAGQEATNEWGAYVSVCLGEVSDYPATDDFAAGECQRVQGGEDYSVSSMVSQALTARLKAADPAFRPPLLASTTFEFMDSTMVSRGIALTFFTHDPQGTIGLSWVAADWSTCGRGVGSEEGGEGGIFDRLEFYRVFVPTIRDFVNDVIDYDQFKDRMTAADPTLRFPETEAVELKSQLSSQLPMLELMLSSAEAAVEGGRICYTPVYL